MARNAKTDGFKLYDCIVRLKGDRDNEVFKPAVTAPEIMVLAAIHGPEAVPQARVNPSKVAYTPQTAEQREEMLSRNVPVAIRDLDERARLQRLYEGNDASKAGFIARLFGPATIPLPREYDIDRMPDAPVAMSRPPAMPDGSVDPEAAFVG